MWPPAFLRKCRYVWSDCVAGRVVRSQIVDWNISTAVTRLSVVLIFAACADRLLPVKKPVRISTRAATTRLCRIVNKRNLRKTLDVRPILSDIIPNLPQNFTGQVVISTVGASAGDIYAIGLRYTGNVFTSIPATLRSNNDISGF